MNTVRRLLSSQRGVTLIELLVVVVILGIIAAVVIPMVTANQQSSYENTNSQNLQIVNEAVQRYVIDHGGSRYPTATGDLPTGSDISPLVDAQLTGRTNAAGGTTDPTLGPYLQEMPAIFDPATGNRFEHNDTPGTTNYAWGVNANGQVEIIEP